MRKCYGLTIVLSLLFLQFSYAQSQKITGKVTDNKTGTPIPNATVSTEDTKVATRTDEGGNFSIEVPATTKKISAQYHRL